MDKNQTYNHREIEKKWQEYWKDRQTFYVDEEAKKEKLYVLTEFPYPSGDGLHAGHLRPNTAIDIIARKKRMEGKNVLFPIGYDAFGLPTENFAIKKNIAPQIVTENNIANFERQFKSIGFSFDWSRTFSTTHKNYYRWTQWIFIQMYKQGLAYKAKENINWCTSCKIGLANEEVVNGACERCGGEVIKKEKEQWMLKITKYADRLIDGLDNVDFLEKIKIQQKNWIGRSEGAEVDFFIECSDDKVNGEAREGGLGQKLKIFTTRPDTLFGATFMVISPEHEILNSLENKISNIKEIKDYIKEAAKKTDLERTELNKEKSGIEIKGLKAINPANNESIPIFVADYVLTSYGTGAIMAVPAHDERDWEFAKKYNLPIIEVIKGGDVDKEAFTDTDSGVAINSGEYDGLSVDEFKKKIIKWLEKNNLGKATKNYRLRDWIFSRQRYWGEPIPMINCPKCGWVPVPENKLPVALPKIDDYKPGDDGESPLKKVKEWVNTNCPDCGGEAKRETDVMPNWAGSNWYFIRYADPKNSLAIIDEDKAKYWLPVDWYQGGMEHTTLHLLYSRFVYKFLYDIGVVPKECGDEPYKKRTAHGMILGEGGIKMSKSKGNVVNPDDYVVKYGADAMRTYIMFMGPFDQDVAWNDKGVAGISRFLNKVWDLQAKLGDIEDNTEIQNLLHKTIKKVGEDIDNMRFNTAVSQLMILANLLDKQKNISKAVLENFVLLLAPFAPHICEEIWHNLGNKKSLSHQAWPEYDSELAKDDNVTIGIQVNGKVRDEIELPIDTEPSESLEKEILVREKIKRNIEGKQVVKFIHIKNKIISIVVK